ncbi:MAG: alpha/beta hydrolase, partial [Pseudomonadota bacterium]
RPGGGQGYDPVPEKYKRRSLRVPNYNGDTGTHEIVFYEWGDPNAARTIVCVHGITRNAHDFDLLAAELARRGLRVLCFSMAGRGESEHLKNPADYNSSNCALDCINLLDQLQLQNVDWAGTSMGGIIGMNIAATHPGRIRKMVINDIGMLVKKEALQRIYCSMFNTPQSFATYTEADTYLRKVCADFGIAHLPEMWKLFFDISFAQNKDRSYSRSYDLAIINPKRADTMDFTQIQDVDFSAFWQAVKIPVLIMRGETSDILDAETVDRMCALNPNAEKVTIQGVGHAPALMTDDQISLVAGWLQRS